MRTMTLSTPTQYAGVQFRSRLEAQWAFIFDRFKIPWEYEPHRFRVGARTYLPDFWLGHWADATWWNARPIWVEVKGDPARLDIDLYAEFAETYGVGVLLLGDVPRIDGWTDVAWRMITGFADDELSLQYWNLTRWREEHALHPARMAMDPYQFARPQGPWLTPVATRDGDVGEAMLAMDAARFLEDSWRARVSGQGWRLRR